MAPEAPADTAGPSSPPPQLPEGWLPQWEGVQRKWYYVQRTTGKSQWEIPTEPVVLTPSTTPIPIGTGPSLTPTPHLTSDSNRAAESGDTMTGGSYSAADSARISNSLHPQIHGQSQNPMLGSSGVPGWYLNHTGQHLPGGYGQHLPANTPGYGLNPLQHGPGGEMNGPQSALYASQTHPSYQIAGLHHVGHNIPPAAWGNNPGIYQGHPSGYSVGQNPQSFQGFPAGPLHNHQPPASWAVSSNLQSQMARETAEVSPPQPQWQLQSQQGHFDRSNEEGRMNVHPSNPPRPRFGSYPSHQNEESSSVEFGRRSSNSALIHELQPYQSSLGNPTENPPHSAVDQGRIGQGYSLSRSHSHNPPKDPALQGFSPLQHVQGQYQQQHMIRAHSDISLTQDSQQYYNPLAQGGVTQYFTQHQLSSGGGPAGFPESAHVHQVPYHQPNQYPEHPPGEPRRPLESQFVSGPWTSAQPSAAQR
ncbi:hypothetical protein N7457_002682 [Penicillium paradoxum]|uniref:uncharacterized protein n=1 Tax=Penicillium paradoxum TaxID=176176 RepID=UPI002547F76E|nr:uncharacterized protein N7457_002682 [Penicillium paradoxum]KAJ5787692.1 hypothetical protein N7457_002682 [Penicillium paradoxum]